MGRPKMLQAMAHHQRREGRVALRHPSGPATPGFAVVADAPAIQAPTEDARTYVWGASPRLIARRATSRR